MKPSDEIFSLIKSMTGKEKLFFRKKFCLMMEDADNNYLKLFEEISKQTLKDDGYDEGKIKKGNYGGKFIKNLPFHKNYLYNSILTSLSLFNRDYKNVYTVRNLITQSEILIDKLLYDQSLKLVQRAKKIASEKNLFSSCFELINTEKQISKYTNSVEDYSVIGHDFSKSNLNYLNSARISLSIMS